MFAVPLVSDVEAAKADVVDDPTIVARGITKYRPIARRTAEFSPPKIPSSGILGVCGWSIVGGRFFFCECGKTV